MNRLALRVFILLLFTGTRVIAQSDPARAPDSLVETLAAATENLLEQSSALDESTILDYSAEVTSLPVTRNYLRGRLRLSQRLQSAAGYVHGDYGGSPLNSLQSVRARYGELGGGIVIAKDAGETRLADFAGGNVFYNGNGALRRLVAGDFRIEGGQGIALWKGRDFSKGSDVVAPVVRQGRGILPSLASDVSGFFRGAAAELGWGISDIQLFYSGRSYAGTIGAGGAVTSVYSSGYFRTANEEAKRNAFGERLAGGHVTLTFPGNDVVGVTYYGTRFSRPLLLKDGRRFSGNGYTLAGLDFSIRYSAMTAFGEWESIAGRIGGISGVFLVPSETFNLVATVRYYPRDYFSFHGSGFGDHAETSDEQGIYLGIKYSPSSEFMFNGYVDHIIFPESPGSHFPSPADEYLASLRYAASAHLKFDAQYYRNRREASIDSLGSPAASAHGLTTTQKIRLEANYQFSTKGDFTVRWERALFSDNRERAPEKGSLAYADVTMRFNSRIQSDVRLAFFNTDSYATRISSYERDIAGVASVPSMYGSGVRWYLLVRTKLTTSVEFSARYSDLLRDDVRYIGTGLDRLSTNHDSRVSIQLDVRLQ